MSLLPIRVLAVADSEMGWPTVAPHEYDLSGPVNESAPDALISLGDYHRVHARAIASAGAPVTAGVYGNHCTDDYLSENGIVDLVGDRRLPARLTSLFLGGREVTVLAVQGCVQYKDRRDHGRDVVFDQEEYDAAIDLLGPAEMVVTHCPPAGINDNPDPAHTGIRALRKWVDRWQPRWLLHGHTYGNVAVSRYGGTDVLYVYGMNLLTLNTTGPSTSQRRIAGGMWVDN